MRINSKTILRFVGVAAIIFALMSAAWPILKFAYRPAFCFGAQLVFGSLGDTNIRLESRSVPEGRMDIQLLIHDASRGIKGELPLSSRDLGYIPTIVMMSLTLALPFPWSRKARALVVGFALVNLYVVFRLGVMLAATLGGEEPGSTYSLGPAADSGLDFAAEIVSISPAGCYLGPLIIWIAVAFREDDWRLANRT